MSDILSRREILERDVKVLTRQIDTAIETLATQRDNMNDLETQLTAANARIEALEKELRWYADAEYDPRLSDDIHDDKGQRARDVMERDDVE